MWRVSHNISEHFRIGGFGYRGKEENQVYISESIGYVYPANLTLMVGGDAYISADPFELNLQVVERSDDTPGFKNRCLNKNLVLFYRV